MTEDVDWVAALGDMIDPAEVAEDLCAGSGPNRDIDSKLLQLRDPEAAVGRDFHWSSPRSGWRGFPVPKYTGEDPNAALELLDDLSGARRHEIALVAVGEGFRGTVDGVPVAAGSASRAICAAAIEIGRAELRRRLKACADWS